MRQRLLEVLLLCFFLSASACKAEAPQVELQFENRDTSKSPVLHVELAVTRGEKQLGLMYRKSMPENEGMLFVFPTEGPRSFWMKNTYLELDMIFLNSKREVVSITPRATPLTETPRSSEAAAQYVLEVGGGLASKWGVIVGSQAVVKSELPQAIE